MTDLIGKEVIIKVGDQSERKGIIEDTILTKYVMQEMGYLICLSPDEHWWYWRDEFDLVEE